MSQHEHDATLWEKVRSTSRLLGQNASKTKRRKTNYTAFTHYLGFNDANMPVFVKQHSTLHYHHGLCFTKKQDAPCERCKSEPLPLSGGESHSRLKSQAHYPVGCLTSHQGNGADSCFHTLTTSLTSAGVGLLKRRRQCLSAESEKRAPAGRRGAQDTMCGFWTHAPQLIKAARSKEQTGAEPTGRREGRRVADTVGGWKYATCNVMQAVQRRF